MEDLFESLDINPYREKIVIDELVVENIKVVSCLFFTLSKCLDLYDTIVLPNPFLECVTKKGLGEMSM